MKFYMMIISLLMHASGNVLGKADVIKWAMSGDIKRDQNKSSF